MKLNRWIATKTAIVVAVIAYLVGSWWFTKLLTTQRPKAPDGPFVMALKQPGGVTYVTPAEHWTHMALIAVGILLVLAWWTVEHFEKRSRTR